MHAHWPLIVYAFILWFSSANHQRNILHRVYEQTKEKNNQQQQQQWQYSKIVCFFLGRSIASQELTIQYQSITFVIVVIHLFHMEVHSYDQAHFMLNHLKFIVNLFWFS